MKNPFSKKAKITKVEVLPAKEVDLKTQLLFAEADLEMVKAEEDPQEYILRFNKVKALKKKITDEQI